MGSCKKNSGVTLVEMVLTLVVISILVGIAYTRWHSVSINVATQASALANDIRHTQNLSMTRAERFRLVFQTNSNSYQVMDSAGNPIALPIGPSGPGSTSINFGTGVSYGAITGLPNNLIVFNSRGVPYVDTGDPGTTLTTTATISLVGGGLTKTIDISPETGRVTIQ